MTKELSTWFVLEIPKVVNTLLQIGFNLSSNEGEAFEENAPYRQLVGALLHLATTVCFDLAYAAGFSSWSVPCTTVLSSCSAKYASHHLNGTSDLEIIFRSGVVYASTAFSDSDWWQESPTKHSIFDFVLVCSGEAVNW